MTTVWREYGLLLRQASHTLSGDEPLWVRLQPLCSQLNVKEIKRTRLPNGRGHLQCNETEARIFLSVSDITAAYRLSGPAGSIERFTPAERLVIAHELGHLILLRNHASKPSGTSEYWRLEEICNDFARRLLIGDTAIAARMDRRKYSPTDLLEESEELAADARVPWSVAAHRISDAKTNIGFIRLEPAKYGFKISVTTLPNMHGTGWLGVGKHIKMDTALYDVVLDIQRRGGLPTQISTDVFQGIAGLEKVSECAGTLRRDGIRIAITR